MLAGTVVLQRTASTRRNGALQLAGIEFGVPEDPERLPGVDWTAGVGRAGDRQPPLASIHLGRSATAEEGEGLEGLEC